MRLKPKPNPFHVGDLVEMKREHIRRGLGGEHHHHTAVVLKLCGHDHLMVHRHGRPGPEFYHISIWRPVRDEVALRAAIAQSHLQPA